jgi:hypothetical protein
MKLRLPALGSRAMAEPLHARPMGRPSVQHQMVATRAHVMCFKGTLLTHAQHSFVRDIEPLALRLHRVWSVGTISG